MSHEGDVCHMRERWMSHEEEVYVTWERGKTCK